MNSVDHNFGSRARRLPPLLIALALTAAACSGSGAGSVAATSTTTERAARQLAADTTVARAVVLQLRDLPHGYTLLVQKPSSVDHSAKDQLLACVHLSDVSHRPGRVQVKGSVFVQRLSSSHVLEVGSSVIIEPTVGDLAARFSALTKTGTPTCLKAYMSARFASDPAFAKLAPSGLEVRSAPVDEVGDQSAAFEGTVTFTVRSRPVEVAFDFYYVRVGRAVALLSTVSLNARFLGSESSALLGTLAGRMKPVA